jgi:hypothetical protein
VKIIERENIDVNKWNALVNRTSDASFFSYAWYLDATTEQWCVLVNEDYSSGIALPYSKRFGIETLYTPIFVRYVEWLGQKQALESAAEIIRERFTNRHISMRQKVLGVGYEEYVYQEIGKNTERKVGSQAKRTLKKAEKNGLVIHQSTEYNSISKVIGTELKDKFAGIDKNSLQALDRLFAAGKNEGVLKSFTIGEEGGIVCFEKDDRILYLKGTVTRDTKENGGMYLALNTAIEIALEQKKIFDFGGSRSEGVKRFNHNLGGEDVEYYSYKVDKTPFWFKFARRIRGTWKK